MYSFLILLFLVNYCFPNVSPQPAWGTSLYSWTVLASRCIIARFSQGVLTFTLNFWALAISFKACTSPLLLGGILSTYSFFLLCDYDCQDFFFWEFSQLHFIISSPRNGTPPTLSPTLILFTITGVLLVATSLLRISPLIWARPIGQFFQPVIPVAESVSIWGTIYFKMVILFTSPITFWYLYAMCHKMSSLTTSKTLPTLL